MPSINPTWRAVAALAAVLPMASCAALGSSPSTTDPTTTVTVAASDGTTTPASGDPMSASTGSRSCADVTADEAVTTVLADLPRPWPEAAWSGTPTDAQSFDPCADLSAIGVVIERPTGSSPKHLLLFHHGEYVGTATNKTVAQLSDVTRVSDSEITARLGTGSGAGAPIPAPTTIRWDDVKDAVVVSTTSSPSPSPSSAGGTTERAGASCAGSTAPSGVDPRVCSRQPTGATPLSVNASTGFAEFGSPSSNIMCELASDYVECVMSSPATRVTLDATGPARRSPGSHPVTTFDRSTLGYGEVGTRGQFACLSEETGVSCWSTTTSHGMFLARERVALW